MKFGKLNFVTSQDEHDITLVIKVDVVNKTLNTETGIPFFTPVKCPSSCCDWDGALSL
jgi:hypothetical protein